MLGVLAEVGEIKGREVYRGVRVAFGMDVGRGVQVGNMVTRWVRLDVTTSGEFVRVGAEVAVCDPTQPARV